MYFNAYFESRKGSTDKIIIATLAEVSKVLTNPFNGLDNLVVKAVF